MKKGKMRMLTKKMRREGRKKRRKMNLSFEYFGQGLHGEHSVRLGGIVRENLIARDGEGEIVIDRGGLSLGRSWKGL